LKFNIHRRQEGIEIATINLKGLNKLLPENISIKVVCPATIYSLIVVVKGVFGTRPSHSDWDQAKVYV